MRCACWGQPAPPSRHRTSSAARRGRLALPSPQPPPSPSSRGRPRRPWRSIDPLILSRAPRGTARGSRPIAAPRRAASSAPSHAPRVPRASAAARAASCRDGAPAHRGRAWRPPTRARAERALHFPCTPTKPERAATPAIFPWANQKMPQRVALDRGRAALSVPAGSSSFAAVPCALDPTATRTASRADLFGAPRLAAAHAPRFRVPQARAHNPTRHARLPP